MDGATIRPRRRARRGSLRRVIVTHPSAGIRAKPSRRCRTRPSRRRRHRGTSHEAAPAVPKMGHLGKARDHAAEMVGVSHGYVADTKRVKEEVLEAFEGLHADDVWRLDRGT